MQRPFLTVLLLSSVPGGGRVAAASQNRFYCDACGEAEEEPQATSTTAAPTHGDDDGTRIVNGWDAKPRPWMALIRAYSLKNELDFETCGGALINSKFVLTAGHCVCLDGSEITPCYDGKFDYDPTKVFRIYLGLNVANIEEAIHKNRDLHENKITKVFKHPGWSGTGEDYPDLTIFELAEKARISTTGIKIQPVCLAPPDMDVENRVGYVAGWGLTRNFDCFTDNAGPERHTRCRFPFIYKGFQVNSCLKSNSPSSDNPKCNQFHESMRGKSGGQIGMGDSVLIVYGKRPKEKKTLCYSESAGSHGWCGTCRKNADFGGYGFCMQGIAPPEDEDTITVVRPTRDWGFCSGLCEQEEDRAQVLQETRLTVLPDHACTTLNSSILIFRSKVEFCGGHKMAFPKTKVYRRYKRRNAKDGNEYIFKLIDVKINTLGAAKHHRKLGYYLGQTDSCQGDSGGPFYTFIDGRAVVIGVVSRGGECAGFNQPGIYTNIAHRKWNDWIRKIADDGSCKKS